MKLSINKPRLAALISATALLTGVLVSIPIAANAAIACDGKSPIQSCAGTTSDGAPFVAQIPANFTGTVALYSHGYRPNVPVVAGIPTFGGKGVINTAEPVPDGNVDVAKYFFSQGVAILGSGFARQGWNIDSALKTNVELIELFKKQFPKTTKVLAWGKSLGGYITQGLAETRPELLTAVAPMCLADSLEAELTAAGDFLWGVKVLFDPSIKGGNYSAGAAGYAESMGDLGKFFTVIVKLQAGIGISTPAGWPDTSSATGKSLAAAGIPVRSALLLLGLMAGLPTQSAHFDSITPGPGPVFGPARLGFPLAFSPALAILENGANAGALAILATADAELQAGGAIFDNTKTNYAARVENERVIFNAALSGDTVINGMLGALSAANPGAPPRAVGNAAAIAKLRALHTNKNKINLPTILMTGVADPITMAGASQLLVDAYATAYADAKAAARKAYKSSRSYVAPANNLIMAWSKTPASWTTFSATGAPITTTAAAPGTNHCNFTTAQYLFVAKSLVTVANTGRLPTGGALNTLKFKGGNLLIDSQYRAPYFKFWNEG